MPEWKNKNTVHRKLQPGLSIKMRWEQIHIIVQVMSITVTVTDVYDSKTECMKD